MTLPLRRRALLALPALLAAPAYAKPAEPIELLVGGRSGSPPDLWARGVAPFLERHWRRVVVTVANQPGRGGLDAIATLAASPPGRQRIGVVTAPQVLARAIEYHGPSPLEQVVPLAAILEEAMVLVGPPEGATGIASLSAVAGQRALATPPPGTAGHLAALRLDGRIDLAPLAFPSPAAARQAALAGHVPAAMLPLPDAIVALRDGRLIGLGITAARRSMALPDVPTLREQGIDLVATAQRGFMLPPGLPPAVRDALRAGLQAVAADPDFAGEAAALGRTARFIGPEAWTRILERVDQDLRQRWQAEPWIARRA